MGKLELRSRQQADEGFADRSGVRSLARQDHRHAIIGPDGKVKEVRGINKIWASISVDNPNATAALQGLKQQFDKRMFSQMLNMSEFMPRGPVGRSWTQNDNFNVPGLGLGKLPTKCRLDDVKDGIATITTSGKLSGGQGGVKFEGEKTGTMQVNIAGSQVVERRLDQVMKVDAKQAGKQLKMDTTAKIWLT